MAHRKAGGTARNLRDSQPKYLGVKIADGQTAKAGSVIVRQRGTRFVAGQNVRTGKDHTLFAVAPGVARFKDVRKKSFDGSVNIRKDVSVIAAK